MFSNKTIKEIIALVLEEVRDGNARISDLQSTSRQLEERIEALSKQISGMEHRMRRSTRFAGDMVASREASSFVNEHLVSARAHPSRLETLKHAVSEAPEGLFLEFGVASGKSLQVICELEPPGRVVGFDTFRGLPEDWRADFGQGKFAQESVPEIDGAELKVGLFQETLEPFLSTTSESIAFLHLDADIYSSTKYVLDQCTSRLAPGAVLLFDEYFNYPGWEHHEHKAFHEWVDANSIEFEYFAYSFQGEQVAVRIKSR